MFAPLLAQVGDAVAAIAANAPGGTSPMQYYLLSAIGGLASVVGFLWLRLEKSQTSMVAKMEAHSEATTAQLKQCEDDRLKLWERVALMEKK